MRKVILQLHLWVGLVVALLLFALGVSGTLLVFEDQIDRALNPQLSYVKSSTAVLPLSELRKYAEAAHPGFTLRQFYLSDRNDLAYAVYLEPQSGRGIEVSINQHTGEVLGTWDDDRFTRKLHAFHTHLLGGELGQEIVGWGGGVLLLFLAMSGLILWWPRKINVFRWSSFGTKFQYDLHNTVGIYASVFLLIFAFTGIAIHWERQTNALAAKLSGGVQARPTVPKVNHLAGAAALLPEQLLAAAQSAAPEAHVTQVNLADDPDSPATVVMKFPEDHTPAGRTRAFVDPYSGKVLYLASSREMPWAITYARRVNREIHTGDLFGWPTKILAAAFSLALPILAISGPLIWWNRKKAVRRAQIRKEVIAA